MVGISCPSLYYKCRHTSRPYYGQEIYPKHIVAHFHPIRGHGIHRVTSHLAENINTVYLCLILNTQPKYPFTGLIVTGFAHLESHFVASVGHFHLVSLQIVTLRIIQVLVFCTLNVAIIVGARTGDTDIVDGSRLILQRFSHIGIPLLLVPTCLCYSQYIGVYGAGTPEVAYDTRTSYRITLCNVAAQPAHPELWRGERRVVFQP